jgi:hypothetical protein
MHVIVMRFVTLRSSARLCARVQDSIPFHFPFRPVKHWERMRLRVEYPLVERDEVIVREQ